MVVVVVVVVGRANLFDMKVLKRPARPFLNQMLLCMFFIYIFFLGGFGATMPLLRCFPSFPETLLVNDSAKNAVFCNSFQATVVVGPSKKS